MEHHQKDWDDHVPLLMMSYRSAVHESTKQTPVKLMFGREVNLPLDLLSGRPPIRVLMIMLKCWRKGWKMCTSLLEYERELQVIE